MYFYVNRIANETEALRAVRGPSRWTESMAGWTRLLFVHACVLMSEPEALSPVNSGMAYECATRFEEHFKTNASFVKVTKRERGGT